MAKIEEITVTIEGREYRLIPKEEASVPGSPAEPKPEPKPEPAAFPLPEDFWDMERFFSSVRKKLFGGRLSQVQVDNINLLLSVCRYANLDPLTDQAAYILGTVYHETARTMEPIEEYGGPTTRYAPWYGRGHVQLTWRENYAKMQEKLRHLSVVELEGIPWRLVSDPTFALHPKTSALICVLGMRDGDFTGVGLGRYINEQSTDYRNARRIVNGTDKADKIAGYAYTFQNSLAK